MIRGVPAAIYGDHRGEAWPYLLHFASRDLDGMTAHDLEMGIIARQRQLWSINDWQAVALTMLTDEAVRITHCAGRGRKDWQEAFDDEMQAWARALGKRRVVALVRPGWARFGKARGYREAHREMAIEV